MQKTKNDGLKFLILKEISWRTEKTRINESKEVNSSEVRVYSGSVGPSTVT